jgi:gluconolactonase
VRPAKDVVATGLEVPEGPVVVGDGRIAFVQQVLGRVSVFDGHRVETISEAPGSPNAVTFGSDDCLYAAQNGGVVGSWRSASPTEPGIERISLDGRVQRVATEVAGVELKAPNDLVFGPDGRLYFTDPSEGYDPDNRRETNRLYALGAGGGEVLVELPPSYTNGIAFTPDDRLVWVETYERLVCVLEDGKRRVICRLPDNHLPDGLDIAADGRMFIATVASHGITVVSPDGETLDLIALDDNALPTNCCFDHNSLWVTDFGVGYEDVGSGRGRLWRVETDAVGKPVYRGSI